MPHYPSNFNDPSLSVNNVTASLELKDALGQNQVGAGYIYPTDLNVSGTGNLQNATQTLGDLYLAMAKLYRDD